MRLFITIDESGIKLHWERPRQVLDYHRGFLWSSSGWEGPISASVAYVLTGRSWLDHKTVYEVEVSNTGELRQEAPLPSADSDRNAFQASMTKSWGEGYQMKNAPTGQALGVETLGKEQLEQPGEVHEENDTSIRFSLLDLD